MLILAWLFVLLILLQHAGGLVPMKADGAVGALYLLAAALSLHSGSAIYRACGVHALRQLAWTFLWAACLSVGLALIQQFQVNQWGWLVVDMPPGGRPFGNIAQPNNLGTLLILGLAGVRFLLGPALRRPVGVLLIIWICLGLVMTQSRTAWLALCGVACIDLWRAYNAKNWRRTQWAVFTIGTWAILMCVWPGVLEVMQLDAGITFGSRVAGADPRQLLWSQLLRAVMEQPWLGWGFGQVAVAQYAVAPFSPASYFFSEYSHNILLDWCIWFGIPAALAAAGVVVWIWSAAVRRVQGRHATFVLTVAGVLFFHAALEYPLAYFYFLFPFCLALGGVDAISRPAGERFEARRTSAAVAATCSCVLVLGAFIAYDYSRLEGAFRDARFRAIGYAGDPGARYQPLLLDRYTALMSLMVSPEVSVNEYVVARSPFSPAIFALAQQQVTHGRADKGRITLVRLCQLHPPDTCDLARVGWQQWESENPSLPRIVFPRTPRRGDVVLQRDEVERIER